MANNLQAEPRSPVPGFFGTMRPKPDFAADAARLAARIQLPQVPQALRERTRKSLESVDLLAKGTRRDAASFEHRLLQRISMGPTISDLELIDEIGPRKYLERQLDPDSLDDGGLEAALLEALPTLGMTPFEILLAHNEEPQVPVYELWIAHLYRILYSPRQLLERMAIFWSDHFNVPVLSDLGPWLKTADDRDVIRAHALGKFSDLLSASAHSAAMLSYLTNDSNGKEHPNENYARELMELHTLGVDGGYTEQDVKEVARALTGWRFFGYRAGLRFGEFLFNSNDHDNDPKVVLGQSLPAGGGISDGEMVLDILANHESTARFISSKMLRYMWGYTADERTVDAIADIYVDTGGDIRSMLRGILSWGRLAAATPKLKRPVHLVTSTTRALFAEIGNPFFLLQALDIAGHLPHAWAPPNGYPDSAGYWSGFVLPRWNFASIALLAQQGLSIDLPFLDPNLPADQLRDLLDLLLLSGTMGDDTSAAILDFLQTQPKTEQTVVEAIGLVLSSPEFQHY